MAATPITDEQLAAYESLLHDVGQTTGRALAARIRAQSAEIAALRAVAAAARTLITELGDEDGQRVGVYREVVAVDRALAALDAAKEGTP